MDNIEFENSDLNRCEKHNQEVILFSLEETDDIKNQLICAQCTKEKQRISNSISWTDVKSMVEAQRQQRLTKLGQSLKPIIDMIEQIQTNIDQIKQNLTNNIKELEQISSNWKQEVELFKAKGFHYSLIQELQIINKILNKTEFTSQDDQKFEEIGQCHSKNYFSLKSQIQQFSLQYEFLKLQEFVESVQQLIEKNLSIMCSDEQIQQQAQNVISR